MGRLILRGFEWTFYAVLFGLTQLWADILMKVGANDLSAFSVLKDGAALFFISSVVIGISVDYYMDPRKSAFPSAWKRLTFFLIPLVVMFLSVLAYQMSRRELNEIELQYFLNLNYALSIICVAYTVAAKAYLYH